MMPFILCAACLEVALNNSERVRELYDEMLQCYELDGCRETFSKIEEEVPKGKVLLKKVVKNSGYDYNTPPERKNIGIPYMRGLIKGGVKLAKEYEGKVNPWALKDKRRKRDIKVLIGKVDELIKVGFNNKSEQSKGIYKVRISENNSLLPAICFRSFGEYCKVKLYQWEKLKIITIGKETYNLADVINDEITTRMHRYLAKNYKAAGFMLKHDQKIINTAERWYKCRVEYSGPEEYCQELFLNEGIALDPANVSNEIRECDEAIGYPRSGKRKTTEFNPGMRMRLFVFLSIVFKYAIGKIKDRFKNR